MHLYPSEKKLVEVDEGGHLKPKADSACYLVAERTIVVEALDRPLRLFWHASEGQVFNDLLRWADEEED